MRDEDFKDFERVDALVRRALDLDRSERESFLIEACGSDARLLESVRQLLDLALKDDDALRPAGGLRGLPLPSESSSHLFFEGELLGPWRIIELIGQGGMARVYRAERADGAYQQDVAVKLLHRPSRSAELAQRFEQERRVLARLGHPNISRLLDGGTTDDGLPYIVMEYVEGQAIDQYCDEQRLSIEDRLSLFLQVCEAVQFAHRQLIVHRDIKPKNILVTRGGVPKLLDFGIAKLLVNESDSVDLTQTLLADRLLTPQYASPEQVLGEPVSTATDVYALGLLLYELLCGQRARQIETSRPRAVERAICETRPTTPSIACTTDHSKSTPASRPVESIASSRQLTPRRLCRRLRGDLDNIVMMALRREPERRYATAQQMAEDVRAFLDMRPVRARPDSLAYRLDRYLRRHLFGAAVAAVASLLMVMTVVFYTMQLTRERDAAEQAAERARIEGAKAEQVSSFLVGLFEASRPDESLGRELNARDLLTQGVEGIEALDAEPEVQARVLSVIAKTHHRLGEFEAAEQLYRRALLQREALFGPEHVQVAESLNDLGVLLKDTAQFESARPLLTRAVELRRKLPDASAADLAISVEELGRLLREEDHLQQAQVLFEEGLKIRREVYGEAHSETLSSLNSVALMYRDIGDFVTAGERFGELVEGYRQVMGERHPWTAIAMGNQAQVLMDLRQWDAAEAIMAEAWSIKQETLDDDHVSLAVTMNHLGEIYREQGRLDESIEMLERAIQIGHAGWGESHPWLAAFHMNKGSAHLLQGGLAESDHHLQFSLAMHEAIFGVSDWRTAEVRVWIGGLRAAQERPDEAETLLLSNYEILVKEKGVEHPVSRQASDLIPPAA
ncbi:MAG: serine/threonine-protein kinase [Pseudomonadota bacterium]